MTALVAILVCALVAGFLVWAISLLPFDPVLVRIAQCAAALACALYLLHHMHWLPHGW